MKTILTKLAVFLLLPTVSFAQVSKSETYQDMFPNNVDEHKLLIILPSIMSKSQIDSLIPGLSATDLEASYQSHVRRTESTIEDIHKYIQKYGLNCELVNKADYNRKKFPSDAYPLMIFPDVVRVNNFHVSHAYRMKDVSNNILYGYARNTEATYTGSYFKQLDGYIKTLRDRKKEQVDNANSSEKIEEDVAEKQRRQNKIRAIAIGASVLLLLVVVRVLTSID